MFELIFELQAFAISLDTAFNIADTFMVIHSTAQWLYIALYQFGQSISHYNQVFEAHSCITPCATPSLEQCLVVINYVFTGINT